MRTIERFWPLVLAMALLLLVYPASHLCRSAGIPVWPWAMVVRVPILIAVAGLVTGWLRRERHLS
jgi:uncharacterized protein (TIGR03382 family)